MARGVRCAVCRHVEVAKIDMLRAGGASFRALAAKFPPLHRDQLYRHWKHVSKERRLALVAGPLKLEEMAAKAAAESKGLVDYLGITRSILFNQLLCGAEAGDRNGVSMIAGRLLENLRDLARLTGELRELSGLTINQTTNVAIMSDPRMLELQSGLLDLCRRHPQARPDIVGLLRRLDGAPATEQGSLPPGAGKDGALGPSEAASARPGLTAPQTIEGSANAAA
jgi:hypothetical protein